MKILLIINKVISYIPLGWMIIFATFILRAYLKSGSMPGGYHNSSPSAVGMSTHHNLSLIGLAIVLYTTIFWVITTILILIINRRKFAKLDAVLYTVQCAIVFVLLFYDPYHLLGWLVDWSLHTFFILNTFSREKYRSYPTPGTNCMHHVNTQHSTSSTIPHIHCLRFLRISPATTITTPGMNSAINAIIAIKIFVAIRENIKLACYPCSRVDGRWYVVAAHFPYLEV